MSQAYYNKIQIFFAARSLDNILNPYLKVYLKQSLDQGIQYVGETSQQKNHRNPTWHNPVPAKYFFQFKQPLKIQLYGTNDKKCIGEWHTCLSSLINKNDYIIGDFSTPKDSQKKIGKIFIQVDTIHHSQYNLLMKWKGDSLKNIKSFFDCIERDNPYLKFYKKRKNNTLAFAAETLPVFSSLQPSFDLIQVPIWRLFSPYVEDPMVKVECYSKEDHQKDLLIGDAYFKSSELGKVPLKLNLVNTKLFGNPGWVVLEQFERKPTPSLIDYLQSGLRLHLCLGIDFTGSNNPHTMTKSLHYVDPNSKDNLNPYQIIIKQVYNILSGYDFDQLINFYGFGAKPNFPTLKSNEVSHCFPLNGNQTDPTVKGLEGLTETYINALENIKFSGPTYFTPLLKEAFHIAEGIKSGYDYLVMLIVTDGTIHDFQETIQLLVQNYHLPLSVVIVGIGDEDFTRMKTFQTYPFSRKIVQFIQYNTIKEDMALLTSQLLNFLPYEIVKFMTNQGKMPVPRKKQNLLEVMLEKFSS